ncbi:MAG: hypothetical protein D6705_13565 [Deltaproteobacteria bacterium]|nr:MAG: hypothetical protein D6705_13565 [Deltaproteobacteria bacterium]
MTLGLVLAIAGCPEGGGGGGGAGGTSTGGTGTDTDTDTTGGTGPSTGGGGIDGEGVGGVADPDALGRSPRTIGMGTPYDTRPMVGIDETFSDVFDAAAWEAGVVVGDGFPGARYSHLRDLGFFALQPVVRSPMVVADGGAGLRMTYEDDGLYMFDVDSIFRTEVTISLRDAEQAQAAYEDFGATHELAGDGLRPYALELFSVPNPGGAPLRGEAVAWVLDGYTDDWVVEGLLSPNELLVRADLWAEVGYRPLCVSSRELGGQTEYAAIFVRDRIDPATTRTWLSLTEDELADLADGLGEQVPFSITSREGAAVFDVLTAAPESQQDAAMAVGLSAAEFRSQDADWRRAGYHLVTAVPYHTPGGDRWVGVWQRYGNAFRSLREPSGSWGTWAGIQAKAAATVMAGGPRQGQLAVLEENQLAYRAAYTTAPEVRPDTTFTTAFPIGSASKSIVAALLLQALSEQGRGPDAPLVKVMGWDPATFTDGSAEMTDVDYTGLGAVTVGDVLAHKAGFSQPGATGWSGKYWTQLEMRADLEAMEPPPPPEVLALPLSSSALEAWMLGVMQGRIDLELEVTDNGTKESAIWDEAFEIASPKYSNINYIIATMMADEMLAAEDGAAGRMRAVAEAAGAGVSVYPVNDTRLPRRGEYHALRIALTMLLGADTAPYADPSTPPAFDATNVFGNMVGRQVSDWPRLPVPQAPWRTYSPSYSAEISVRGMNLGAGGVEATAEDLARLFRALVRPAGDGGEVDPEVSLALRTKQVDLPECPWCDGYGLGVYLYRNWVMAAGNIGGLAALAAHNVAYDVTFAWLGTARNSPLGIFGPTDLLPLESLYPCIDDLQTPRDECSVGVPPVIGG